MPECSLLRPLDIGGLRLENNILQAPLAGFSGWPFRELAWRLGRPGLLATEMISAHALHLDAPGQEAYLARGPASGPVQYQLWGSRPESFATATRRAEDAGAAAIDLNCGCPVRKVRAAGAGSKLMETPELIGRIVSVIRSRTALPVSVKLRVGPNAATRNAVLAARIAAAEGVDFITVHGRHAGEAYQTPVRLDEIARVAAAAPVPVIGNGDVRDGLTARRMMRETGVAGVMVGRACLGAPWVFARIRAELAGVAWSPPDPRETGACFLEHHDLLVRHLGAERAIRHCRKLGTFYAKSFPGAKDIRSRINLCRTRDDLARLLADGLWSAAGSGAGSGAGSDAGSAAGSAAGSGDGSGDRP